MISGAIAQDNNNQHNLLLKPTTRQAIERLKQPCRFWSQQSLRTTLNEISRRFDIAIWLDRRIDPTQLVDLPQATENSSLGLELVRLADSIGAGAGLVENIYLVAPRDRLARIQKAAVVLHGQLSSTGKSVVQKVKPLQWSDVTSYQELLSHIQEIWNVEIEVSLPHDLLHAGYFPECSLATQLAILLGGFDLQATMAAVNRNTEQTASVSTPDTGLPIESHPNAEPPLSGREERLAIKIRPISNSIHWKDRYARTANRELLEELTNRFSSDQLEQVSNGWLLVNGETNLHYEIVSIGIGSGRRRNSTSDESQQLYTFNIEAKLPVEAVLLELSKNFQLELEWSEQCGAADRNRLVQLKAENVTRQQLLELVCERANLSCEQTEKGWIIHPGPGLP